MRLPLLNRNYIPPLQLWLFLILQQHSLSFFFDTATSPPPFFLSSSCSKFQLYSYSYQNEPQWIDERRCLLVPSRKEINRNKVSTDFILKYNDDDNDKEKEMAKQSQMDDLPLPPIVILGGMAQSISSWEHHLPTLSRERDVFVYEYLGSGLGYRHPQHPHQHGDGYSDSNSDSNSDRNSDGDASLKSENEYYKDVTLKKQAQELKRILQKSFPNCDAFDIIGFSLGARISLATIASFPTLIRKAHLTGVGLERSSFAKVVIHSWKDILQSSYNNNNDDSNFSSLTAFAWSIIMTTYSQEFLALNGADKVASWVHHICSNNNPIGLLKLLEQTHGDVIDNDNKLDNDDNVDSFSRNEMLMIGKQIRRNNSNNLSATTTTTTRGQIHMGGMDQISTLGQARELNELIGWNDNKTDEDNDIVIYDQCGHAVMNEDGRTWRKNVLDYLLK
jgi:pimeloyl-ACP methyl ester carboxylesterase